MLYFKFKNYEEFKAKFGTRIANNGKQVRSNHIVLSFLKHEFKCKRFRNLALMNIDNILYRIQCDIRYGFNYQSLMNNEAVYSNELYLDDRRGVCEDGDEKSVRYVRRDNGRTFKMKAGKFYRHVLEQCGLTEKYCEQVIIYACEKFSEDWTAYVKSNYGSGLQLHVNDKFYRIYDGDYLKGDFNSCMVDDEQYSFYEDAVKAKAAYLTDSDDMIVARCVIFTEVFVEGEDTTLRLAERQYSSEQDNTLKQILINKLIEGGHIDGYKRVGVDCHNKRAFVLNDGTDISHKNLSIACHLDWDDTISYQDSFKHFDMDSQEADNHGYGSIDLSTTDSTLQGGEEYDSYHGRYCESVRTVYVWSEPRDRYIEETCDEDDIDDFHYCERYADYYDEVYWSDYESDYIPYGEEVFCELHDEYLWRDRSSYCEIADDYFPDDDYNEYLREWKSQNWSYDELNDEYVEEVTECHIWNRFFESYESMNVGVSYAEDHFYMYEGEWYSDVNEDGIPFTMVEELEECECV